ncbi:hypothetical protein GCM10007358_15420 [Phocicoccus schoeneichii]|uniref:Uncharacterized protein n=1 Tax=Phocicoccus schoeneichii TaxID=1812261 RepID=A0A6V7QZS3_9BACL|nr:hypothetical protein GCM10007358_15420 [Jeotgalicoccus schoeneichii]CAD2070486.1 hypothetical protein JEOSCH030_00007 [Jeotgalicoccus schoeneichii]
MDIIKLKMKNDNENRNANNITFLQGSRLSSLFKKLTKIETPKLVAANKTYPKMISIISPSSIYFSLYLSY